MDNAEQAVLAADLAGGLPCGLNHGPGQLVPMAVDYVVQGIGFSRGMTTTVVAEVTIPVCIDCAMALQGAEWVLLYCGSCHASQWIERSKARREYSERFNWLESCPKCWQQEKNDIY